MRPVHHAAEGLQDGGEGLLIKTITALKGNITRKVKFSHGQSNIGLLCPSQQNGVAALSKTREEAGDWFENIKRQTVARVALRC